MAIFKPFSAFRPKSDLAKAVASRPYDVLSSSEAKMEATDNPHSFLRVIKPEIELSDNIDPIQARFTREGQRIIMLSNLKEFLSRIQIHTFISTVLQWMVVCKPGWLDVAIMRNITQGK